MPVQCLIRKLTRAQVDKMIADQAMQQRLVLQDGSAGELLLVVNADSEAGDHEANVALQRIADADAAITQKDREAADKTTRKPAKP